MYEIRFKQAVPPHSDPGRLAGLHRGRFVSSLRGAGQPNLIEERGLEGAQDPKMVTKLHYIYNALWLPISLMARISMFPRRPIRGHLGRFDREPDPAYQLSHKSNLEGPVIDSRGIPYGPPGFRGRRSP